MLTGAATHPRPVMRRAWADATALTADGFLNGSNTVHGHVHDEIPALLPLVARLILAAPTLGRKAG